MALTNKLTAIGNAIRGKTGKTELLTLDQMPTEISNIQGGGTVELVKDSEVFYLNTPERNEAGSPNYFGVMTLISALKEIDKIGYDKLLIHEKELLKYLIDGLK